MGTFCSSTLSSPTIEESSDKPGKLDSCLISSVSTAATQAGILLFNVENQLSEFLGY